MPYDVFINALLSAPSRLLGMEPIFDAAEAGKHGFDTGDDFTHDGKIIYPKCRSTVFPPSEFDPKNVVRSSKAPSATLELEHVYGYAGLENTAPNLFYLTSGEVVYYTAALGVVLDKDKLEKKKPCQVSLFGYFWLFLVIFGYFWQFPYGQLVTDAVFCLPLTAIFPRARRRHQVPRDPP